MSPPHKSVGRVETLSQRQAVTHDSAVAASVEPIVDAAPKVPKCGLSQEAIELSLGYGHPFTQCVTFARTRVGGSRA